ncbi:hypothetical protein, partial [Hydrogenophaga sp.]|uniref:hypothetical protein n=1 Tax=Hydrogenophaga sp. TaxID=1904254 RepID=UPI003F6ADE13
SGCRALRVWTALTVSTVYNIQKNGGGQPVVEKFPKILGFIAIWNGAQAPNHRTMAVDLKLITVYSILK